MMQNFWILLIVFSVLWEQSCLVGNWIFPVKMVIMGILSDACCCDIMIIIDLRVVYLCNALNIMHSVFHSAEKCNPVSFAMGFNVNFYLPRDFSHLLLDHAEISLLEQNYCAFVKTLTKSFLASKSLLTLVDSCLDHVHHMDHQLCVNHDFTTQCSCNL